MRTKPPTPRDRLSLELVTSPLWKKSRTTSGSKVNDSEEDEEWTCSNEIRSRGGEKLDATTTQGDIEEEPEPNPNQVIDNIQIELVVSIEPVVSIIDSTAVVIESFQLVQPIVEPIQIENLKFSKFQPIPIFGHSTKTLQHISMFWEQIAQNATTWLRTLQKLSNLRVEFKQVKENLSKTHNHQQTYSLKLETEQRTLKNRDKKLVIVKGQLNRVQHENENLSIKLNEAEHAARKIENL